MAFSGSMWGNYLESSLRESERETLIGQHHLDTSQPLLSVRFETEREFIPSSPHFPDKKNRMKKVGKERQREWERGRAHYRQRLSPSMRWDYMCVREGGRERRKGACTQSERGRGQGEGEVLGQQSKSAREERALHWAKRGKFYERRRSAGGGAGRERVCVCVCAQEYVREWEHVSVQDEESEGEKPKSSMSWLGLCS